MDAGSRGRLPRLEWPGREAAMAMATDVCTNTVDDFHLAESFSESPAPGGVYQGDNLKILAHLANRRTRFNLIYADPPFLVGRNFHQKTRVKLPDGRIVNVQSNAYDDHWNRDESAYLSMILPRLILMREVLADDGVFCLHADHRMIGYLRALLDEIFGRERFRNEIIWNYAQGSAPANRFPCKHDTILVYTKGKSAPFNATEARIPYTPHAQDKRGKNYGGTMGIDEDGREYVEKWGTGKRKKYRYYLDEGKTCPDVWTDIQSIQSAAGERTGYPTQKPLAILDRLIRVYTNPGDHVADFFAGSGTTAAAAASLERKWLVADASPQAVHQVRKRLLSTMTPFRIFRLQDDPIPPLAGRAAIRDNTLEILEYTPDKSLASQLGDLTGDAGKYLIDVVTVDTRPSRKDECHRIAACWWRQTPDDHPRVGLPIPREAHQPAVFAIDLFGRRVSFAMTTD